MRRYAACPVARMGLGPVHLLVSPKAGRDPVTAPDNPLVEVIAQAMTDSDFAEMNTCGDPEYYDRLARAVLAAISQAGTVEWATGEGLGLITWRDRAQAERQSASATKSYDRGATWQHTNPPVVSRVTFPWERDE